MLKATVEEIRGRLPRRLELGKDGACSRVGDAQRSGIVGGTVSHLSARPGDALDTWESG